MLISQNIHKTYKYINFACWFYNITVLVIWWNKNEADESVITECFYQIHSVNNKFMLIINVCTLQKFTFCDLIW